MPYLVFKTDVRVPTLFTLATNLSYTVFLTTSSFTTLLSLLKSTLIHQNLFYLLQLLDYLKLMLVQN